jgi:hypothetical protein
MVTLPMTVRAFSNMEDLYILSIAATANVNTIDVKILDVNEVSRRSLSIPMLLLSASNIQIKTSVLLGEQEVKRLLNEALLNQNLNANGLPDGRVALVVQDANSSAAVQSGNIPISPGSPSPSVGAESVNSAAASSTFPIGAVAGGAAGCVLLLVCACLFLRGRNCFTAKEVNT